MSRLPLGLICLFVLALAIIGATAIDLVRHPPTPPPLDLDCPVHESGNPWCDRLRP